MVYISPRPEYREHLLAAVKPGSTPQPVRPKPMRRLLTLAQKQSPPQPTGYGAGNPH